MWKLLAVAVLVLLVGQCRSCSDKKKTVQNEKMQAAEAILMAKERQSFKQELATFLAEFDPSLSAKRDETLRAIRDNQEIRDKLRANIEKFPTPEAKAIFQDRAERYERMIEQLNQLLTAIDKNAEIAMAQVEVSRNEGAGIQEADSQGLLDSAAMILRHSSALQEDLEAFTNDDGTPSAPDEQRSNEEQEAADPKIQELAAKASELEKMADQAAAALELINKNDPAQPEQENAPKSQKPTAPTRNPGPILDQEAIQKEIRRLDASIATKEANLNRAWARINKITRNGTIPIVKGSRQHVEYLSIHRVLTDSETQLPPLKNRREALKAKITNR